MGASAGGLDAFEGLLAGLGSTPGVAIVFVQHLDPSSKSLLHELPAKRTDMEVVRLTEGRRKLKTDTVYVCPPQTLLDLSNGSVRLSKPDYAGRQPNVIDHFLHSIAEDQGNRGVGITSSKRRAARCSPRLTAKKPSTTSPIRVRPLRI